ncbi:MAG: hypothetical protein KDA37_13325 [Planctomycetales bacterium]|nr:hypothetical protein [Planctomycetales bacterium]
MNVHTLLLVLITKYTLAAGMGRASRGVVALAGACLLLLCSGSPAWSRIELARVFDDNMVLQAEMPVRVWGAASPNSSISVTLGDKTLHTSADREGAWSVGFPPLAASKAATTFRVEGDNGAAVQLGNVLVGEVWLAAGQSNMAWPLSQVLNAQHELRQAALPALRFYQLTGATHTGRGVYTQEQLAHLDPPNYMRGNWNSCSPESAGPLSAVAFFFGKQLHRRLDAPVGIVCAAVGGTPTESWIRRSTLRQSPELSALTAGNWLENDLLCEWCRQRAKENLNWGESRRRDLPSDDLGPYHPFRPGYMWEAGIAQLCGLQFRGVLWYQGESNAESAGLVEQHRRLFETLVTDWRSQLQREDLPFLFVQLPALGRPHWPAFRQSQWECSREIEHTGMVVTIDRGHPTNVHPTDKKPVGVRLANLALARVYRKEDAQRYLCPTPRAARTEGQKAWVSFDGVGGGLVSSDGAPLRHFEIAGNDREYLAASASIVGAGVAVWNDAVSSPSFVRYAWAPYPTPPLNLYNEAGLPASPFELPVAHQAD